MRNPIEVKAQGDFKNLTGLLERTKNFFNIGVLDKYGQKGVEALRRETPSKSLETANSWYYKIKRQNGQAIIEYHNSNIQNGVNIALILYTGHATKDGYWVQGVDYINPALKPIFEEMAKDALKEATEKNG